MKQNLGRQFVVLILLTIAAALPLRAQIPASEPPTVTFQLANHATIHQHSGTVSVVVTFADSVGLKAGMITGAFSGVSTEYVSGTKTAQCTLLFFARAFPVGDYTFDATAINVKGIRTNRQITLHLVH